jgi:hypothetical protein
MSWFTRMHTFQLHQSSIKIKMGGFMMTCLTYAISIESPSSPPSTLLGVENSTSQRYEVYYLGAYCSGMEEDCMYL